MCCELSVALEDFKVVVTTVAADPFYVSWLIVPSVFIISKHIFKIIKTGDAETV